MKAVILVAGKGTRMEPLTVTLPKCLLSVLNKPILMWQIESLQGLVNEIILVVRSPQTDPTQQAIIDYVQNLQLSIKSIKFNFVVVQEALGTGDAVWQCKEYLIDQERFFVLYGDDVYIAEDLRNLFQNQFAILSQKVNDPEKWGILEVDSQNNLIKITEKPIEFVGNLANCGAYILGKQLFTYQKSLQRSPRGEFELTDLVSEFAKNFQVQVVPAIKWLPVSYPWHLLETSKQLLDRIDFLVEGEIETNVTIKGRLKLGKGSIIKSGTYIEGDVVIGEGCVIGPNAYLRGPVIIGDKSEVKFSTEIKNTVIMENSKIPHLSYIADSIIGNNVNVGGNSIFANVRHDGQSVKTMIKGVLVDTGLRKFGAVIGDGVKIGVKTIIYPGRKIWPNQTTLPAQVVDRDIIS